MAKIRTGPLRPRSSLMVKCGYSLKALTSSLRSTASRDNSLLDALVCSAPDAVELDKSRILTRFLSTSRDTLACSSAALAIEVL